MEVRALVFIISLAVIIACVIAFCVIIHKKNDQIDKLEYDKDILQVQIDGLRKDRNDLYERYMASLEREARRDG